MKFKDYLTENECPEGQHWCPIEKKCVTPKGKGKESVDEGEKNYYEQHGIGKAKYTVSSHDGKAKHKDGSPFYDMKIFKNKKDLEKYKTDLSKKGFKYKRP